MGTPLSKTGPTSSISLGSISEVWVSRMPAIGIPRPDGQGDGEDDFVPVAGDNNQGTGFAGENEVRVPNARRQRRDGRGRC